MIIILSCASRKAFLLTKTLIRYKMISHKYIFNPRNIKNMNFKKNCKETAVWLLLSIIMGALGGGVGAGFSFTVSGVTSIRENNGWLIFLLPLAGLLSVALSRCSRSSGFGTISMFDCAKSSQKAVPLNLSFSAFAGTALTHLCGGSAGKEGAALQIGGGLSAIFAKILRIDRKRQKTLLLCAMSAMFSAVFGTPLTAAVFAIEAARIERKRFLELLPCEISALIGFLTAYSLGVKPERFHIPAVAKADAVLILVLLGVAVAASLFGELFCFTLRFVSAKAKLFLRNEYFRILVGGLLVILITVIIGNTRYNGSSITTLHNIFSNMQVRYEDFALKFLLTVITVSFGFKGGQIIPSLFIGAALGGAIGMLFGVSVPIAAAVGLAASFCAVTNCMLSAFLLSFELFSGKAIVYLMAAVIIARLISGRINLYGDTPPIFKKKYIESEINKA